MKLASSSPSSHHKTNHHLSNTSSSTVLYQQKDWELEKASILQKTQEYYQNYIEDLQMKHEQDKIKYDKDKKSLLRKLYSQDKQMEEIKENYTNQIKDYQIKIQTAEKNYKFKEKERKRQYETTLQTEQEKYDRRLNGFQQRMNAKDEEYAKLLDNDGVVQRQTKSAPTSPTCSSFSSTNNSDFRTSRRQKFRHQPLPATVTQEQYDCDINELKEKINALVSTHQKELEKVQHHRRLELEQLESKLQNHCTKQVGDALQPEGHPNKELLQLINSFQSEKKSHVERLAHVDALREQMNIDRTREFNMHQTIIHDLKVDKEELKEKYRSKMHQMNEKFNRSEARMKSLFMNENQQLTMHCEARVENLGAEHLNNMQELKDALENEKEVVQIKHQTAMEEQTRGFEKEKQDWKKEQDGLVQEIKVLSDKVDQTQQQKEKVRMDYAKYKKESSLKLKELVNLQQEQKTAKRIARGVLSSVSQSETEAEDPNLSIVDLLRKTLSNISSLHTRSSIMEQSMESPYYMMSPYGY